ncbi:MAG: hypothetical protein NZ824_07115 [Candidatus Thioglobus sp.]|nr:hypothetical protein [Candidatus Thioglobus sp.]
MKQNKTLAIAIAALFTSSLALADSEVSGKLVLEQAGLTDGGNLKNEMKFKLYADGDITDNMTYHAELQGSSDSDKVGGYSGEYTQNANLREMYVDINGGAFDARIGKQQVVWGTADGMKLLDMINPTDYAEMAQDQMEDSRIPVWAVNLERDNVQMIISQPKENVFAGLNRGTDTSIRGNDMMQADQTSNNGTDTGNAFLMMGPDSITGEVNGFLNIAPDLGSIASKFSMAFDQSAAWATSPSLGNMNAAMMEGFTVDAFEGMTMDTMAGAMAGSGPIDYATNLPPGFASAVTGTFNYLDGNGYIGSGPGQINISGAGELTGAHMLAYGFAPSYNTNLANMTPGQDTAFDFMGSATFRTFDAFVNARSQYVYDMPKGTNADIAIRSSHTTKGGSNYSLNFSNSYDKNPVIDLSWVAEDGTALQATNTGGTMYITDAATGTVNYGGSEQQAAMNAWIVANAANPAAPTPAEQGAAWTSARADKGAILQFKQGVRKVKNIGGSFDTSFNSSALGPVVVRGEALYTIDGAQPVMNLDKLAVGDLVGALSMQNADRIKFVLGVDITVLTNMMISGQYITDRNLDHKDNGNEYTTDYATMHLSNGFNKAIEDKQFYSLFFSKPFGDSGQHRWNNIYMFEEGDGNWNRLDVSWGLSDDVEGTFELNNYWGEHNTQFGQLKGSSNIQTGLKYSF